MADSTRSSGVTAAAIVGLIGVRRRRVAGVLRTGGMMSRAIGMAFGIALVLWAMSAAAQTPPDVERDAREYVRLALRHDEIAFKAGQGAITSAEREEMSRLRVQVSDVQKKYAPGGPMSKQAAAFQKRIATLSATEGAIARRGWEINARNQTAVKLRSGSNTYWTAMTAACLVALAIPLLIVMAGQRHRGRQVLASSDPAFQLPAALTRVKVFRMSYDVNVDGGVLAGYRDYYAPKSPGGGHFTGGTGTRMAQFSDGSYHEIADHSGKSGSVRKQMPNRRVFLYETPDGRTGERHVDLYGRRAKADRDFMLTDPGDRVAFIGCGEDGLLCLNHRTGQLSLTKDVARIHTFRPIVMMSLTYAVAFIGLVLATFVLLPRLETSNPLLSAAMMPWMLGMVLVCIVNVLIINAFLSAIRGYQFRSTWKPQFEAFLKAHPPQSPRSNRRKAATV